MERINLKRTGEEVEARIEIIKENGSGSLTRTMKRH